jgi:hypothetical protein
MGFWKGRGLSAGVAEGSFRVAAARLRSMSWGNGVCGFAPFDVCVLAARLLPVCVTAALSWLCDTPRCAQQAHSCMPHQTCLHTYLPASCNYLYISHVRGVAFTGGAWWRLVYVAAGPGSEGLCMPSWLPAPLHGGGPHTHTATWPGLCRAGPNSGRSGGTLTQLNSSCRRKNDHPPAFCDGPVV